MIEFSLVRSLRKHILSPTNFHIDKKNKRKRERKQPQPGLHKPCIWNLFGEMDCSVRPLRAFLDLSTFYPPTNILAYKLFITQLVVKKKRCLGLRHFLHLPSAFQTELFLFFFSCSCRDSWKSQEFGAVVTWGGGVKLGKKYQLQFGGILVLSSM